jgi:hypothetical protein
MANLYAVIIIPEHFVDRPAEVVKQPNPVDPDKEQDRDSR